MTPLGYHAGEAGQTGRAEIFMTTLHRSKSVTEVFEKETNPRSTAPREAIHASFRCTHLRP